MVYIPFVKNVERELNDLGKRGCKSQISDKYSEGSCYVDLTQQVYVKSLWDVHSTNSNNR